MTAERVGYGILVVCAFFGFLLFNLDVTRTQPATEAVSQKSATPDGSTTPTTTALTEEPPHVAMTFEEMQKAFQGTLGTPTKEPTAKELADLMEDCRANPYAQRYRGPAPWDPRSEVEFIGCNKTKGWFWEIINGGVDVHARKDMCPYLNLPAGLCYFEDPREYADYEALAKK